MQKTGLRQLSDFAAAQGSFPSRLALKTEMERLLAEEEKKLKQPFIGIDPGTKDGDKSAYSMLFVGETKEEADKMVLAYAAEQVAVSAALQPSQEGAK